MASLRACKPQDFCYSWVTPAQSSAALPEIRVLQITLNEVLELPVLRLCSRSGEGKGRCCSSGKDSVAQTEGPQRLGSRLDLPCGCPSPSLCFPQSDPDLPPEPQTSSSAEVGKFPGLPSHPVSQYVPPQPSIEEARQTMHSLLDDAFALVAPSSQAASAAAGPPPGVSAAQPVRAAAGQGWERCTRWGSPHGPARAANSASVMQFKGVCGQGVSTGWATAAVVVPLLSRLTTNTEHSWNKESSEMTITRWLTCFLSCLLSFPFSHLSHKGRWEFSFKIISVLPS